MVAPALITADAVVYLDRFARDSTKRMALRIGFVIANHTGHLNSALGLAQQCLRAGHGVLFIGGAEQHPVVSANGLPFLNADFIKPLDPPWRERLNLSRLGEYRRLTEVRLGEAGATVRQALEVVERQRLDLIAYDPFLLAYHIAFGARGTPGVALSSTPLLDYDDWVTPYTSHIIPRGRLRRAAVTLAWASAWATYAAFRLRKASVRALTGYSTLRFCQALARCSRYDLGRQWRCRPVSFDFALRDVPEVVLWSAELDFPRKRPSPWHARHVGPCVKTSEAVAAFDWGGPPRGQKRILCAISTESRAAGPQQLAFLRRVIDAFRDDPGCRLVIAAGAQSTALLADLPAHIRVASSVPLQAALRGATVLISHGGANAVKEAISHGVPLVLYPARADQPGNAARAVHAGLALRGTRRDPAPTIRRKVLRVATDTRFRENALAMQRVFERYDQAQWGVRALEAIARGQAHRPSAESPAGGVGSPESPSRVAG